MEHLTDMQKPLPYECRDCKHFISGCRCKAFEQIPIGFIMDAEQHDSVVPGQNGQFVFETDKGRQAINSYELSDIES